MISTTTTIFALIFILPVFFHLRRRTLWPPSPPGPKGIPLIGVAFEHPTSEYWKTYAEWGRKYSKRILPDDGTLEQNEGIISFHVFGRRIVVLNTARAAEEILDQNSAVYSDRPQPTMAAILMKREKSIFWLKNDERLRLYRKLMHQDFNQVASQKYWEFQQEEAHLLALSLLRDQDKRNDNKSNDYSQLGKFLRKNAAAVIMRIAYGYTLKDYDDYFVAMAEESMRVGSLAAAPGKWLVDSFPILRFLPRWFPGAGFRKQADTWSKQLYDQSIVPVSFVKEQMAAGKAVSSYTANHLQSSPQEEDAIIWTAWALYAGAADTTTSTVKTFFLLMLLHPTVQARAHDEIMRVIGNERLPTLEDRSRLPYVNAILLEVLRWAPPSVMGMPHASAKDDIFRGYSICKGQTIIANIWAIMHDENVYPEPHIFNPDRFLQTHSDASSGLNINEQFNEQPDPRQWVFGFGRRICPGMHIAEASLFTQISTLLAVLEICPEVDTFTGREVTPSVEFTTAIVSYVKDFPYRVRPRSGEVVALVRDSIEAMDVESRLR